MNFLASMKVGTRLGAGFGLLLLFVTLIALLGINRMAFLQENIDRIVHLDFVKIELASAMRDAVRYQAVALRDVVLQEDLAFKKKELKLMREARKKYATATEELEKLIASTDTNSYLTKIKSTEAQIQPLVDETIEFSLNDQHVKAGDVVRDKLRPVQIQLIQELEEMLAYFEKENQEAAIEAKKTYRITQVLMIVLGGIAMALGVTVAFFITRSITTPLNIAVDVANKISSGDLTAKIADVGHDEMGKLLQALREMNLNLSNIIGGVKDAANNVSGYSAKLSGAAGQVSSRAETQVAQVMQVGAAMEEMAVSISEVAVGTGGVVEAAAKTQRVAQEGSQNIAKGVESSKRIMVCVETSSATIGELSREIQKISEVTNVIKDIADQTNLLALNAAIEAARAGEQGRGFAVVADEVRKLAERTSVSTTDITEMVTSISNRTVAAVQSMNQVQQSVRDGEHFNALTRDIFSQIVAAAEEVNTLARDIALATKEQKAATSDTAVSMEKISVITEENSISIHDVGTAAETLAGTASELQRLVDQFKLG
jgi:methyl-accepting chemotaxis protein